MVRKNAKPGKLFTREKKPSVFRKMACAWWDNPSNPQIYGSMNVDMTECLRFIREYERKQKKKLTITHLLVKAIALAYRKFPELNVKVERNKIYRRNSIDIHLLVSAESGGDLSAIKMNRADGMSLNEIFDKVKKGARGVRANKGPTFRRSRNIIRNRSIFTTRFLLRMAGWLVNKKHRDLSKLGFPLDPFGTAIISSVGMFGVETAFAPFLPLARCGVILVVTQVKDRPWVSDGKVVVRPVMKLCGTFDHRIFTGHQAGLFSQEVKDILMNPVRLED